MKHETKKETKEKVYEIGTMLSFYATIPVLGVDEDDARNNLYDIYKEEFSCLPSRLLDECQEEGWVDNGYMDDSDMYEVSEGDEELRDYLLEKRKKREDWKSRPKVSKPLEVLDLSLFGLA